MNDLINTQFEYILSVSTEFKLFVEELKSKTNEEIIEEYQLDVSVISYSALSKMPS